MTAMMRETTLHLMPHAERLLRRLRSLEEPLVELWGWPGSGASAVLQALLGLPDAVGLPLADLPAEDAGRAAFAALAGARWIVLAGDPGELLDDLARWISPGQQLVFVSNRRRSESSLPLALVPPQELLLNAAEVARLWHLLCARQPGPSSVQALWRATDGWYRPLRMALEASGGVGLEAATAEQLLEITQVRHFLRYQVLDALPPGRRELLLHARRERPAAVDGGGAAAVSEAVDAGAATPAGTAGAVAAAGGPQAAERDAWRVVDEHGFWVEDGEWDRLPALLAATLERERRRRRVATGSPVVASSGGREAPRQRPAYQVRLLGAPVVRQVGEGDGREVAWKLRRSFLVLAFLASSPGLQAVRDDLEGAIWPAEGERTIDRNFHPTLSHLRRSLERDDRREREGRREPKGRTGREGGGAGVGRGAREAGGARGTAPPPLLYRGGIYRLNPEIDWDIDVQELAARVAEGRELQERGEESAAIVAWQQAWRLHRGPFLQGHFEAWAVARRETYQEVFVDLLRALGDLLVRLERAEDALDAFRALLLEDPLQERTHLAVMRLYAGQGRRDLVRRQYERLCTLLLDELGVEPLPETIQGYHRLMS
jgi:DNA-binding SARP family transcriptional activator